MKVRGFEVVADQFRKHKGEIKLPTRGTARAMAYDFYAPKSYIVHPGETVKIWTDVKAYMQDNEALILNIRSSMGGKFTMTSIQGWVDADYYGNLGNDGNIGIFLTNICESVIFIEKGDRIGQGMFISYLTADSGNVDTTRVGGFGSTN